MYRKLKVCLTKYCTVVPSYISGETLFVNTRQHNVDVLNQKQCYSLKLRIQYCHNIVFKSAFYSSSFKVWKNFAKWREYIEVTRIQRCLVFSLDLSKTFDLPFIAYVDRNKRRFLFIYFVFLFCREYPWFFKIVGRSSTSILNWLNQIKSLIKRSNTL